MSAVTDIADRLAAWEDGLGYGGGDHSTAAAMADDIRALLAAVGHADDDIPGPPTITTIIGELERIRAHRGDLPVLTPASDGAPQTMVMVAGRPWLAPVSDGAYVRCTEAAPVVADVCHDGTGYWVPGRASGEPARKAVIFR